MHIYIYIKERNLTYLNIHNDELNESSLGEDDDRISFIFKIFYYENRHYHILCKSGKRKYPA